MPRSLSIRLLHLLLVSCLLTGSACGDELPLHVLIDQQVERACQQQKVPLAERCSDADFVRRIHLDLTGVVPDVTTTRAFLIRCRLDACGEWVALPASHSTDSGFGPSLICENCRRSGSSNNSANTAATYGNSPAASTSDVSFPIGKRSRYRMKRRSLRTLTTSKSCKPGRWN